MYLDYVPGYYCEEYRAKSRTISGMNLNFVKLFLVFSEIAIFRSFSQFAYTSGARTANMYPDYDSGYCCEECRAKSRTISGMNQNFIKIFLVFSEIAIFARFRNLRILAAQGQRICFLIIIQDVAAENTECNPERFLV